MKKTLLLVFIHGFKGSDHTFHQFPHELAKALSQALPKINVLSVQYPQYETRGDLRGCVAKFKEWLQNKTIDLEVANRVRRAHSKNASSQLLTYDQTPSPTVDPSVHIILVGHSMGGIVAAETLLSIARDEPVPSSYANDTTNSTTGHSSRANDASASRPTNLETPDQDERASSAPPREPTRLFFPYVKAVLAFDTPYLGISPGVLAHGAEDRYNQGTAAYKAWDTASQLFGWNSPKGSGASTPIANASSRGLPAADGSTGSSWGKYAMYGGAAAAIAGVAGAAYLNWNQINQGLTWAGSHLEFVGCLARGAELQKRVEKIVELERSHGTGFANFYGALGEKVTSQTKYAGILGDDRTFCVIPTATRKAASPTGTKRDRPVEQTPPDANKKRKTDPGIEDQAAQAQQVHDFAEDITKSKGHWVKCVNQLATDELKAHTSMFAPEKNSDYKHMLPRARDQIMEWIDSDWYESSHVQQEPPPEEENTTAGGETEEHPS